MSFFKKVFLSLFYFISIAGLFSGCKNNLKDTAPAIPFVKFNNSIYSLDSTGYTTSSLKKNYIVIGKITAKTQYASTAGNGESSCCNIGEKIYQTPNNLNELFVYTTVFTNNKEYRFIRFVKGNSENASISSG